MRTRAALVFFIVVGACSSGVREEPTPEREPEPSVAPTTPSPLPPSPVEPAAPVAPPSTAAADAQRAYLAAVQAFNRRDADAYFAAFEPTLSCFYGQAGVTRERVRRDRWHEGETGVLMSVQLTVLSADESRVLLLDRGFFRESRGDAAAFRQVMHQKLVALHRTDGVWRIAAETSSTNRACLGDLVRESFAPDERFETCRATHHACLGACARGLASGGCTGDDASCERCADLCQDDGLRCIGVPVARASDGAPAIVVTVQTEDDVRRLLTLDRAERDGSITPTDRGWLEGARTALGAPMFHVTADDGEGTVCGPSPFLPDFAWSDYESYAITEVQCARDAAGALARCAVTLDVEGYRRQESIDLSLVFDGPSLRAVHRDPARPRGPAPSGLLERYASTHPPEWDASCGAALVALGADRAAEDFFDVRDGDDEEWATVNVQRFCGAEATRAVHALGDAWDCDDEGCQLEGGCGNYCETIELDDAGAIRAHVAGMAGIELTAEMAARARDAIPCGRTRALTIEP